MKEETETIDKLYLELSQFTQALNGREFRVMSILVALRDNEEMPGRFLPAIQQAIDELMP